MSLFEKELQKFNSIYRGTVVDNLGSQGQCKIFVIGVYPTEYKDDSSALPWAEPAMPLFGGNFTNKNGTLNAEATINTTPHVGAEVFVFFENGDHNHPIFFATSCGGSGWKAEHENQHIIQTDNVRIIIDEKLDDPKSTSKFGSYNENCTENSKVAANIPTRVNIECQGNVHLRVFGSVNMQVNGNFYKEINGNVHETINGNIYRMIKGNIEEDINGDIRKYHGGKLKEIHFGDTDLNHIGKTVAFYNGDITHNINANVSDLINGNVTKTVNGNVLNTINIGSFTTFVNAGGMSTTVFGIVKNRFCADFTTEVIGNFNEIINMNVNKAVGLNITEVTKGNIISTIKGNATDVITGNLKVTAARIDLN